ncbi:MAG: hypothetical protein WDO71_17280 [Bacteroidota bacterium]
MKKTGVPIFFAAILLSFFACKSKKKEGPQKEKFFPVLSFIKSQVAHVDTSLYSIRKIIYVDSTRNDTVYYKREQFRDLAADFLSLPDLSSSKYEDRFKEEKQFDETLNRVIITYQPIDPGKEEIQRQEVLIQPDPSGDKVTSFIIDYFTNNKDSSVQKRMLWQVDKSFQVATMRQLPGQPETNSTLRVTWNEDDQ